MSRQSPRSLVAGARCAETYCMGQLGGRSAMRAVAGPPLSGTGYSRDLEPLVV